MSRVALLASVLGTSSAADQVLLVGLYKDSGASVLSYSINRGTFSPLASSDIGVGPSWIIPAHRGRADNLQGYATSLFTISETGTGNGTVASLSLDCKGNIAETSRVSSQGAAPVFLATDPMSDHVLVANYGGGSVSVLPVSWKDNQATLEAASQTLEFGANAHAHSAYFMPDCGAECSVFVPTLGLDEVQQLKYSGGKLSKAHTPLSVPAQQGPRHLAFHPTLPIAVLANEGSASAKVTIELLAVDKEKGLSTIATYSASGPYSAPDLYPAEVVFTESGYFVLVSLRDATDQKRDGVASFKVEENGRNLSLVDYASVGHYPRSMTLSKDGLVIVGNQKGNSLSFLSLDFATGKLTKAKDDLDVGDSPAFVGIFDLAQGCNPTMSTVVV